MKSQYHVVHQHGSTPWASVATLEQALAECRKARVNIGANPYIHGPNGRILVDNVGTAANPKFVVSRWNGVVADAREPSI